MSGVLSQLIGQRRLIFSAALIMATLGLAMWLTMPRQEDPSMERRWGLVTVSFPGIEAESIERLLVEPLEESLAEVDQIKKIRSTSRMGFALLDLELRDDVKDFTLAWDDIEKAAGEAQQDFPAGAGAPIVDRDMRDTDSVVLAFGGGDQTVEVSGHAIDRLQAAKQLKQHLYGIEGVSRVNLIADPGEQITIEFEDSVAQRLGVDATMLANQLSARNIASSGGTIRLGKRSAALRPQSEFRSLEEIRQTPIVLPSGSSVPLGELATVRRGPVEPSNARMRVDGKEVIGLGVVPRDEIDLVKFGERVRSRIDELRPEFAPYTIEEVTFQPDRVRHRIDDLSRSLLQGIGIVALVLVLAMGFRLGLVVAAVVPLVVLSSLAIYAIGGGVLHQMSIAALVIALGILVDNAIVVAESIQRKIDEGSSRQAAAGAAVRELSLPLGVATGTTLAAFIPMLLSEGGAAEFTAAIPIIIMVTLSVSYVFAIIFTPSLSALVLRASKKNNEGKKSENRLGRLGRWLGQRVVARPWVVLGLVGILVAASVSSAGGVQQRFFPASDRNQVVVDLTLPEGSHISEIDSATQRLEAVMQEHPGVQHVASFVGRSVPHFYYNLKMQPQSPHLAQVLLVTTGKATNAGVIEQVHEFARQEMPEVQVIARRLEQGPPISAPIEVRLLGTDLADLRIAVDQVLSVLSSIPGTVNVRDNLTMGAPTVRVDIDDAASGRRAVSRYDVSSALLGRTRGLLVGEYRAEEDPIPILIRGTQGEDLPLEQISGVAIGGGGLSEQKSSAPTLEQLAHTQVEWRPSAIRHYNRRRVASVMAELDGGLVYSVVDPILRERLKEIELPKGVQLEFGGEGESSGDANVALFRNLPIGLLMLLAFLMVEFNSFRRVGMILTTVPLAVTGVVPGLILGGQPFGFMAMLGVIALVGIVVNNAIVLIDFVDERRKAGLSVGDAIVEAVRVRTRPILLTTVTTVAGLLPLALSEAALWPPLAWAMITGLLASTALTLVVVPAMYRLLFREEHHSTVVS